MRGAHENPARAWQTPFMAFANRWLSMAFACVGLGACAASPKPVLSVAEYDLSCSKVEVSRVDDDHYRALDSDRSPGVAATPGRRHASLAPPHLASPQGGLCTRTGSCTNSRAAAQKVYW